MEFVTNSLHAEILSISKAIVNGLVKSAGTAYLMETVVAIWAGFAGFALEMLFIST